MEKKQATQKELKEKYSIILKAGYCALQRLLSFDDAKYYNAGANGWNYDVYEFGNVAIVTGYNPIGQSVDYDLIKEYDDKANRVRSDYHVTVSEQREQIAALIAEFISKAKK